MIYFHLRRGKADPNDYKTRCRRRRKKPQTRPDGEWYTWQPSDHDKAAGRVEDYLPPEYVDSLEREHRAKARQAFKRKIGLIKNTALFLRDVIPVMVTAEKYFPYGRQIALDGRQTRADVVAALKALRVLGTAVRFNTADIMDALEMDVDTFRWWQRGYYCAYGVLVRLAANDGRAWGSD